MTKKRPLPQPAVHPKPAAETATKKLTRSEQSRINGAQSKGPISDAGKLRSSRSALKHGLTASIHTVLNHESEDGYNENLEAWIDDLRPATKVELRLVRQVANIQWRLERLALMETALLNVEMSVHLAATLDTFEHIDDVGVLAAAWKSSADSSNGIDLLRRYLTSLQHQFNSTLKTFRSLEDRRTDPRRIRDLDYAPPYEQPHINVPQPDDQENEEDEENNQPSASASTPIAPLRMEPDSPRSDDDNKANDKPKIPCNSPGRKAA